MQIPACSQCFQEGKIVRSGQVSGEAVYSTRGPVQKTHQGRAEYDLAGRGAASDPRVVEEDRACSPQPWFVGSSQTKTQSH